MYKCTSEGKLHWASIARGLADADAGRMKPAEEVFKRLAKKARRVKVRITAEAERDLERIVDYIAQDNLPAVPDSMVVFGLGYGIESLREVSWLKRRRVIYWADIDTHGYHILSRCREYWPQVESMLMDEGTLRAWAPLAGAEPGKSRDTGMPPRLGGGRKRCVCRIDRGSVRLPPSY